MPRRNLLWLFLITVASLLCYYYTPDRYGRTLAGAMEHVSHSYYTEVNDADLFQGAMTGMIDRLNKDTKNDDQNSEYLPPVEARQFEQEINKQFGGVGMNVGSDPKTKQLVVISPLPGTPAYRNGIHAGDKILKIDGRSTQGMSLKDAVQRMHGEPGTPVVLTLGREGVEQPLDKSLVREIIQVETVMGDTRGADGSWNFLLPGKDRIGYIRLTGFAEGEETDGDTRRNKTVVHLERALRQSADEGMRGLVLDLRDNPGGSLAAAIGVCKLFIEPGPIDNLVIVTTRGRDGRILREEVAKENGPFTGFPMAVLVNQYSASASEIVAACLQDHGRAVVVGQRTYGKGTVQEVRNLGGDYGTLKLTIATYWRPSGQDIHCHRRDDRRADDPNATWGVTPDEGCQVVVPDEELVRYLRWRQDRDVMHPDGRPAPAADGAKPFVDRPLEKAVQWVERAIGK